MKTDEIDAARMSGGYVHEDLMEQADYSWWDDLAAAAPWAGLILFCAFLISMYVALR